MVIFDKKEYKHYSQPGQFLSAVAECSGGCGTKFDDSYKCRLPGNWVYGCLVGKRFCTKDKKDYDVECNFARCAVCHMSALEQHESESGGGMGGRSTRRKRVAS